MMLKQPGFRCFSANRRFMSARTTKSQTLGQLGLHGGAPSGKRRVRSCIGNAFGDWNLKSCQVTRQRFVHGSAGASSSSSSSSSSWLSSTSKLTRNKAQMKVAAFGAIGLAAFGLSTIMNQDKTAQTEEMKKPKMTSKFSYYSGHGLIDPSKVRVFAGTGNAELAQDIAKYLEVDLGSMNVSKFADGECSIKVNENVRGKHVVLIQSCAPPNVNDSLMELLLMISTMRRSSAKTITVIAPYFPYARSDNISSEVKGTIAAKDTVRMLEVMGMDRLLAVDLHSGQVQGFLSNEVPSDNISAIKVGALMFSEMKLNAENLVVVAPNPQAVYIAKDFWNVLLQKGMKKCRFAMVLRKPSLGDQKRKLLKNQGDESEQVAYELVGDDGIAGGDAIIVQDIIDSAESICNAARALKQNGAKRVFVFASHGVFSPGSLDRIRDSCIEQVLVTNTVRCMPQSDESKGKVSQLSVAPLIAEAIRRICEKESLSPLFKLPTE